MIPKVIVDAERHRRTPRTPAIDGKMVKSKASADIGDIGAEIGGKNMSKTCKYHQKGYQNGCQIHQKSSKNQVCVLGAFLATFGLPFSPKTPKPGLPFGSHFRQKLEKLHPEIDAKIDAEKILKNDAKLSRK